MLTVEEMAYGSQAVESITVYIESFPHQIFDAWPQHLQNLLLVLTPLHLIDRISSQVRKGDWIVEEWEKIRQEANTAGDSVCFDPSGSDSERTSPFRR